MRLLAEILKEILGLFLGDGLLALGLLVWVALAALLLPPLGLANPAGGPLLFAGAAAVLAASLVRAGRGE